MNTLTNDKAGFKGGSGETSSSKEKDFLAILNNKTKEAAAAAGVNKVTKFKTFNFEKRTSTRYSLPLCHYDGYNLWLLKPTHLNRGRGIHVFRDLETMHKLIRDYCQGKEEEVKVAAKKDGASPPKEGGTAGECQMMEDGMGGTACSGLAEEYPQT
jgi:hypothetical protein